MSIEMNSSAAIDNERGVDILRLPSVLTKTGLGRSTIYTWMESGHFPRSIQLGPRAVGWLAVEVEQWIEARLVLRSRTY